MPRRRRRRIEPSRRATARTRLAARTRPSDPWSAYPAVLRVEHLAELLGVTPNAIGESARRGNLPAVKRLGKWMMTQEAFRAWMSGVVVEAQAPAAAPASVAPVSPACCAELRR